MNDFQFILNDAITGIWWSFFYGMVFGFIMGFIRLIILLSTEN